MVRGWNKGEKTNSLHRRNYTCSNHKFKTFHVQNYEETLLQSSNHCIRLHHYFKEQSCRYNLRQSDFSTLRYNTATYGRHSLRYLGPINYGETVFGWQKWSACQVYVLNGFWFLVGPLYMPQTNQTEASMNNHSNYCLQRLQRQQVCADSCWCRLNTTSKIWRRNHHHLMVFHAGLWWQELEISTYICLFEKWSFRMRISTVITVDIPTEITETRENVTTNKHGPSAM